MRDQIIQIENGTVFSKPWVYAKVAIQMIKSGAAVPAGDMAIRLTFKDYITAVQRPSSGSKSFKDSSPGQALAPLQDEMVYSGSRQDGATVTCSAMVLKKMRGGKLVNWTEKDRFRSGRFNPDALPPARYQNRAQYEAARAARA
jgi:hypothetical protein